jgi:hypothetical protein
MTFVWWVAWALVSLVMGHSMHVSIEDMNAWGATLVFSIAIDLLQVWNKGPAQT